MATDGTWHPIRAYVDARMAELGIRSYADLAAEADLDADTITNVLDGRGRPQRRTRVSLGKALLWPPDWLDYLREGRHPPDARDERPVATYRTRDDIRDVPEDELARLEEYARGRLGAAQVDRTLKLVEVTENALRDLGWSYGEGRDEGPDIVALREPGAPDPIALFIEVKAIYPGQEADQISKALGRLMLYRAVDLPEEEYGSRLVVVTDLPIEPRLVDRLREFEVHHAWPGDWTALRPG